VQQDYREAGKWFLMAAEAGIRAPPSTTSFAAQRQSPYRS
jgi:hypothetical protein